MKTNTAIIILLLFIFPIYCMAQQKETDPEARIKELGIQLITPSPPVANYLKAVRVGNMIYLSGHGPDKADGGRITGKVGAGISPSQAHDAAKMACISLLSTLKAEIGDLNKVKRIVKVFGMVNAVPTFEDHPQVINGCSDLLVAVFGENGKHARSAIGVASLPFNIPVEIEMIVELKE